MLIERGNPYASGPPPVLRLDWDDFRFAISSVNRAALGRRAKWAVVAYLAGDCNLSRHLFDDLLEMKSVGSNDDVHVLALFDGELPADSFIARLNRGTPLGDDLLMRFNELDTSNPKLLTQVLLLAQAYPAERRLVILAGHGSGWRGALVDENLGRRFLHDPGRLVLPGVGAACDAELERCQRIAQDELNAAIGPAADATAGPVDVLAFDACYMGNLESMGSFGSSARWLIVSEDQWPGDGFDYRNLLQTLQRQPGVATDALARDWIANSAAYYRAAAQQGKPVTLAAIDASKLPALGAAVVRFAQSLDPRDAEVMQSLHDALDATWRDSRTGLADLKGLVQQLLARPIPQPCRDAAVALLRRLGDAVTAACGGLAPDSTNGLSIYAPRPEDFDTDYIRLANGLPLSLGIWAWVLGGYYLHRLADKAPGHPLVASLRATMEAAQSKGDWRPSAKAPATRGNPDP
jgi:hypothetical protein